MRVFLTIGLAMTVVGCTSPSAVARPTPEATEVVAAAMPPLAETSSATPALPPTPTPAPTIGPLPSDLDPAIKRAIEDRRMYRLRYDLDYVLKVASDPAAFDAIGFPIYQEEWDQVGRDQAEQQRIIQAINRHPSAPQDDGGLYIDRDVMPGVVVALFTANVAAHEAAIRAELGHTDLFATRQVKYSKTELADVQERVSQDMDAPWVLAIPAIYYSVGADVMNNVVDVSISSSVPEAAAIIARHYGLGDRLSVVSDGTGSMLIPWGTVVGRVTFRGEPVSIPMTAGASLAWDRPGDAVGTCGGGDVGYGVGRDGRFELPCQVGRRTILVQIPGTGDGEWRTIGTGRVIVREGKTTRLEIKLTELPG